MTNRKGIILAGGTGSRLFPLTHAASKQMLPVYDKPMIYYPITTLLEVGIREIAIITTPDHRSAFEQLLSDGSQWGASFTYISQPEPKGLAQAYLLARQFLAGAPSAMVLGDNLFYGPELPNLIRQAADRLRGATVFGKSVADPSRYGVVGFDANCRPVKILEKPRVPPSDIAITGLYLLDARASDWAKWITPSERGELEITDLLDMYIQAEELEVVKLGAGTAWFDTGTHGSLLQAANFVQLLSHNQGIWLGYPELVAEKNGYINTESVSDIAMQYGKTDYGRALMQALSAGSETAVASERFAVAS